MRLDNGPTVRLPHPFPDPPLSVIDARRGSIATIERPAPAAGTRAPSSFTIPRTSLAGDTIHARTYAYQPRPLSRAAKDSAFASFARSLASGPAGTSPDRAESVVRRALTLPSFHPPVRDAPHASDGALWLRMETMPADPLQIWEVHDTLGAVIARVRLPGSLDIRAVTDDVVWAVEHDELDVLYVMGYVLVKG